MTFIISVFQMYVLHFGHFFENWKNSGLTLGQNDDPMTQWPGRERWPKWPIDQFHVLWGGSHRISDPAPVVWDQLHLITDPVAHNWDPAPFCWDPPLCTVYIWAFFLYAWCFVKKYSPSRSFCHLHLSLLGVDRWCKRQTLSKCHKSQTECLGLSKTPGQQPGGPPSSALGPSGSSFGPSSLAPIGTHHLLLSDWTTVCRERTADIMTESSDYYAHRGQ